MTAKPCKHPKLDKKLRCKACGVLVDIREKKNKYGAKRTNGFASAKEEKRYRYLKSLEDAHKIFDLELQPRFDFDINGVKLCTYVGDFKYFESFSDAAVDANPIIEDAKGVKTPVYRLKKKMMMAFHGIEIREV